MEAQIAATVREALDLASERAGRDAIIAVTGSLYVVAEAREALGLASEMDEAIFNPWASR
jgi:folylpolyglutamate synthase/dihydropteroate synthase